MSDQEGIGSPIEAIDAIRNVLDELEEAIRRGDLRKDSSLILEWREVSKNLDVALLRLGYETEVFLRDLGIPDKTRKALRRTDPNIVEREEIKTVFDLFQASFESVKKARNIGKLRFIELVQILVSNGLLPEGVNPSWMLKDDSNRTFYEVAIDSIGK